MKFDEKNFDEFTVVFIGKGEKVRRKNFDQSLTINFVKFVKISPCQTFALYGIEVACMLHSS